MLRLFTEVNKLTANTYILVIPILIVGDLMAQKSVVNRRESNPVDLLRVVGPETVGMSVESMQRSGEFSGRLERLRKVVHNDKPSTIPVSWNWITQWGRN